MAGTTGLTAWPKGTCGENSWKYTLGGGMKHRTNIRRMIDVHETLIPTV